MQLILNTETDIGIQRKMSAIEQESFEEKFINKAENVDDEIPNIKDKSIKEEIVEDCDTNGDKETNEKVAEDDENISNVNLNDISNKDEIENCSDTELSVECKKENSIEVADVEIKYEEPEEIKNEITEVDEVKKEEYKEETQTDNQSKEDENECKNLNEEKQDKEENKIRTENTIENNVTKEIDTNLQESNDDNLVKTEIPVEKESEKNEETSDAVENGEVISIPDEKEEENITMIDQEMTDVEKQPETSTNTNNNQSTDLSTNSTTDTSSDKKIDVENKDHDCVEKDNEPEIKIQSPSKDTILDGDKVELLDKVVKDTNETSDECSEQGNNIKEVPEKKSSPNNNNVKETKKLSLICKLSNTLDILSDDEEEEPTKKESQDELSSVEKQCINIEDDDDIMLIDEESNVKDVEKNSEDSVEAKIEDEECKEMPHVNTMNIEPVEEKDILNVSKDSTNNIETDVKKTEEEEKSTESKPTSLLPVNFLKTCKKNLADMTRDELEEFCILKIVESVVDRSNLSEIKAQLKTLGQNIEEYKKKALMLTKQNRDLQVVLKSVQEEQKKKSDAPITPLKITRSVGMQVFMADKTKNVRMKSSLMSHNPQINVIPSNTPNRINKSQPNQSPKSQKAQGNVNTTQQIPVPRLVPAVNNANTNKLQTPTNIAPKTPVSANLPNGIKNSPPTQKPEKRPHSKMQQGNSVTVDLTDDEPPTKVLQRNVNPPVRLVSPQNLLAPQRQPFATTINSPRKVYIPISGSQNQVRPGQTIMLKPIQTAGTRPRLPSILPKTSGKAVTMTRITNRHPAPLPDSMKQYQPPNWKALPPAPELKLSKVENGIVISWKIDGYQEDNHEEIASYQLYAYQETSSPPSTALWKKIGDVKALPLPMACTLTQFMAGYKYYFAVRAVDIRSRLGPFSAPGSILLLNKM